MRSRAALALSSLTLIALAGCGSGVTLSTTAPLNLNGNWQIQSASLPTGSLPATQVLLLGALESQGSHITGAFRFSNLTAPASACALDQPITVSGTLDSAGNVVLTSASFSGYQVTIQLVVRTTPEITASGTIAVTGSGPCGAASQPAIGLLFAPVTGVYAGPVMPQITGASGGTATLSVTQGASSGSDGQFPISGTLQFASTACSSTLPISGTVSGPLLTLNPTQPNPSGTTLLSGGGVSDPIRSQISINFAFVYGPCASSGGSFSVYSGTLSKQ